jgi:hypothetical protein
LSADAEDRDFSEYEFDADIVDFNGFAIGDIVSIVEDDPHENYYEGEEGQVVGFALIAAAESPELARAFGNDAHERIAIFVLMEDATEPIEVKPEHMEGE